MPFKLRYIHALAISTSLFIFCPTLTKAADETAEAADTESEIVVYGRGEKLIGVASQASQGVVAGAARADGSHGRQPTSGCVRLR